VMASLEDKAMFVGQFAHDRLKTPAIVFDHGVAAG